MRLHIAITGASGTIYAQRLIERTSGLERVSKIYITLTQTATLVARHELSEQIIEQLAATPKAEILDNQNYFNGVASGSSAPEAMVIIPCSMGMLARVANGISSDLISRSADVMLKEERKLIVVPRETPLSLIHLENMVKLQKAGATILPATPSFYAKGQTIIDMVDSVVDRIMDHLSLDDVKYRWMGSK
ncbi:MAG: UbiX family flavin prenyltransferase [Rikenellaceae bacterium]